MIVRPPSGSARRRRVYDDLFSGVDLVPTLLDLLGRRRFPTTWRAFARQRSCATNPRTRPVRTEVYTTKTYHDSFDPIRAIRTKEFSYIENYAPRPLLDLPWDIEESAPGQAVAPLSPRTAARNASSTICAPTRPSATTC